MTMRRILVLPEQSIPLDIVCPAGIVSGRVFSDIVLPQP
jgi:hypothetical protein